MFVSTAAKNLKQWETKGRSIAQENAIIRQGERQMDEYIKNILKYRCSIQSAMDWYKSGWITYAEFKKTDKLLADKYGIPGDSIFLEHEWINSKWYGE